ncbi:MULTISPECIES: hypothetical protein [Paenibacillus]|uniref:hypothetical protein n=1 Tax=Paenibacillus TaxID=44249 RepID=UPI0022B92DF5|nr:hypothetical protein [Paenibacillus caseinilyticus]MCZ8522322.1 hypothetical protein [Paenibacillus caseinilyticus]
MNKVRHVLYALILSLLLPAAALASSDGYTPVPPSSNTHPAYITGLTLQDDSLYLAADYIQWFEGDEADRVFAEKEPDSGLSRTPNGYYIVNDNPKLRTLKVSGDAKVLMQIYNRTGKPGGADIRWNEEVTPQRFAEILKEEPYLLDYPYHLVTENGEVVRIVQQYIP